MRRMAAALPRDARSVIVSSVLLVGAALSLFAGMFAANAQTFPVKPIRLIVPFAPGGSTDILARIVGQKLTEAWGQQVLVENRPGGGTVIGTEIVAKSAPDGYTLVMTSTSTATLPSSSWATSRQHSPSVSISSHVRPSITPMLGLPHSTMNAVTMPNIPAVDSTWGRMWQCHTQAPGASTCTSTE